MTESKRPLKVFLCHAHADRDAVHALHTRLTNDGVDAWLDKAKLLPGQNWRIEIQNAVEEADVVIVCHSEEFNKEGFRQREVKWALDVAMEKPEGEIFIIPARLEDCEVIKSLSDWHWVDLFEEDGYEMLMRALRMRANKIGATLQIKKEWISRAKDSQAIKTEKKGKVSAFFRIIFGIVIFGGLTLTILFGLKPLFALPYLTSSTTSLSVASANITNVNDVTQPSTFVIYTPTILIKNPCEFTLLKNANLYEIPAARKIRELKQGEIIIVTRVLSDEGWLLVENESQVNGWVDGSVISGLGSCAPIIYDLADAVLLKNELLEVQDTFNGDTRFSFINTGGSPEYKMLDGGEKILHLGTSLIGRKIFMYLGLLKPEGATQRGSETLRLVFNASYENNGFLGLMWGNYYPRKEFRVYPKSNFYTLNDVTDKKLTQIDVGDIVCNANHSWAETNYLEIKYQSDENITTVQIDDCEPIFFSNIGGFKDFLYITSYDLTGLDLYYFLLSGFK